MIQNIRALILVLVGFVSCNGPLDIASWEVEATSPLVYGRMNIADLLAVKEISSEGGVLQYRVQDTLVRLGVDTLIGIPDTTLVSEFMIPVGGVQWPAGVPFYSDTIRTTFNLDGAQLSFAEVRKALFSVSLKNNLKEQILVRYRILSATQNGDTFELEELVPGKSTFEGDFVLDGYNLDFRGLDGTRSNTLNAYVEAMIDPNFTGTYTFSAGESFEIQNTFKEIIPQYAQGYFGQQLTQYEDSVTIDLFKSLAFRSADILEYDVDITIDNGIGADLLFEIGGVSTYNSSSVVSLGHPILGEPQPIGRAIRTAGLASPVKHMQQHYSFTSSNSNLDELLEIRPNGIAYNMSLEINPLGDISLGNDFVRFGHDISASMDLTVPLKFGVEGLLLRDTFAMNVDTSDSEQIDRILGGVIRGKILNGYPFEATVQLLFLDSNGVVTDSLSDIRQTIQSAEANGFGMVINSVESEVVFPFDRDRVDAVLGATQAVVLARFDTYQSQIVELRDSYEIEFRFAADLNTTLP